MIVLFSASVLVLMAVLAWFAQGLMDKAYSRYRSAFKKEARARLSEFFLFVDPARLWMANLALCGGLMLALYVLAGSVWPALAAGALALFAPQALIVRLRRDRLLRFDQQLPDMLLALAGALRAGSAVQAALRHIVAQAPAPLAQEFGLMLREQRLGIPFEQALEGLYRRMPTEAAALIVSSLKVAAQSGGNLAETLEAMAGTLRARLHLLGRIRALTSQGRLQAWVMGCLPFVLALVLEWLDPDSMAPLWHTGAGWAVIGLVLGLEAAGLLFIRRIVNIQV